MKDSLENEERTDAMHLRPWAEMTLMWGFFWDGD
jgi:hypothetical protein